MPVRPSPALLMTIGAVLVTGLAGVVVLGLANGVPPVHVALIAWLTATYSVSGLIAWWCRPNNRFGPLMVLTGTSSMVGALSWAEGGLLHTVGQAADLLPLILMVQVFLTFPTGRLHG